MKQQESWDRFYMGIVDKSAELSYAPDKKVGALVVTTDEAMFMSYNGTIPGTDNSTVDHEGKTPESVLHAEVGAILKATKTTSVLAGTLYCSLSPCIHCAKVIYQSGIERVIYKEKYKHGEPALKFLKQAGVWVNQIGEERVPHCDLFTKLQLKETGFV